MIASPRTFLVLGGARSGKTRHAMALAAQHPHRTYIATAEAHDEEMRERIRNHQAERDHSWSTVEAPLYLAEVIASLQDGSTAIMVDCLTLWLSNLFGAAADLEKETDKLLAIIVSSKNRLVLVSNEVGLGIVPANALARRFRDAQGRFNQQVAAVVDHVDFVAAGLPFNLKPGR
ncbi:MAG: bifunctional adenosylcobinamide kinase/adenosylcobinamide-phosphate guanylyltransferase [Pseudomonadota bacterium]